jgi:threonine/homoserine/homoserine lactone efflux protein
VLRYLPLFLAWSVAVVSPGPDFLAVLRSSAGRSRRAGVLVALGVVTGIGCWSIAALVGVTAVLARYEHLYLVLRLAGSAFLIGYGLLTLRSAWRRHTSAYSGGGPLERAGPARSGWHSWRLGLLTNLSNPKALFFFGALFATLLPASANFVARAEVLGAMLLLAFGWFATVAALASVPAAITAYRRGRTAIDAVTGGLFVALGGALATT